MHEPGALCTAHRQLNWSGSESSLAALLACFPPQKLLTASTIFRRTSHESCKFQFFPDMQVFTSHSLGHLPPFYEDVSVRRKLLDNNGPWGL